MASRAFKHSLGARTSLDSLLCLSASGDWVPGPCLPDPRATEHRRDLLGQRKMYQKCTQTDGLDSCPVSDNNSNPAELWPATRPRNTASCLVEEDDSLSKVGGSLRQVAAWRALQQTCPSPTGAALGSTLDTAFPSNPGQPQTQNIASTSLPSQPPIFRPPPPWKAHVYAISPKEDSRLTRCLNSVDHALGADPGQFLRGVSKESKVSSMPKSSIPERGTLAIGLWGGGDDETPRPKPLLCPAVETQAPSQASSGCES